jgi:cytochrome b561
MKINHPLEKACILTFIITALTSIPLLFNYLKGVSPKLQWIVDLHVWFGIAFIIFVLIRIVRNRKSIKDKINGGK